jgi:hypothetical protein
MGIPEERLEAEIRIGDILERILQVLMHVLSHINEEQARITGTHATCHGPKDEEPS